MPADREFAPSVIGDGGRQQLAPLTTIGLGGPAPQFEVASSTAEVAELVGGRDVLVLGGGSNVVIADRGVETPVVHMRVRGIDIEKGKGVVAVPLRDAILTVGAGENWDDVVAQTLAEGWCGLETLSGIPGSAGATPIQNVGAYGTELSDLLLSVQVFDRRARMVRTMTRDELRLGYRTSSLRGTDRAVVTAVRLHLLHRSRPIRYPELAAMLGVAVGQRAPATDVRQAVLELRRRKGMVIDPQDADTRSVGSFFTNPILADADLDDAMARIRARVGSETRVPQYPADGGTKLSAAWLIEQAGFTKGYPGAERPGAGITISTKHTLALTNRGHGTTAELVALARRIRDGVRDAFGVVLVPEPILIGVDLDDPTAP